MKIKPWFLYWVKENSGKKPTREIEITENGTYNVTNYATANVNIPITNNAKVITVMENPASGFLGKKFLVELPVIDMNNMSAMTNLFLQCNNLEKIEGIINTSSVTNMTECFENCYKLKKIPYFDTSNVTAMASSFRSCSILETIPLLNTAKVMNMANTFYDSPNLSDETLNNILKMCAIATRVSSGKSLDSIGLSSTQINRCKTLSNYQEFLDAGWTA